MNIEQDVFKRCHVNTNKLLEYGFIKKDDNYIYEKIFLNDFQAIIQVNSKGQVTGKVIDIDLNEEYTNIRLENTASFINKVKESYKKILIDIRNNCYNKEFFISKQANRISKLINEYYGDNPIFEWDDYPGFGVFKNNSTKKWYALIMNITKDKLKAGTGSFDIINVKLDPKVIEELLKKEGFYPAYHMNKKYWITISLDDSVPDKEIFELIKTSHLYTEKGTSTNEWIIPANPNYFDIDEAFKNIKSIIWKQSTNIKVGDTIYLYVGSPVSAIRYKCRVEEVNIPYDYNDKNVKMKYVMKIKQLDSYDKKLFPFSKLKEYGVNAIRGPRFMPKELSNYINKKEG